MIRLLACFVMYLKPKVHSKMDTHSRAKPCFVWCNRAVEQNILRNLGKI